LDRASGRAVTSVGASENAKTNHGREDRAKPNANKRDLEVGGSNPEGAVFSLKDQKQYLSDDDNSLFALLPEASEGRDEEQKASDDAAFVGSHTATVASLAHSSKKEGDERENNADSACGSKADNSKEQSNAKLSRDTHAEATDNGVDSPLVSSYDGVEAEPEAASTSTKCLELRNNSTCMSSKTLPEDCNASVDVSVEAKMQRSLGCEKLKVASPDPGKDGSCPVSTATGDKINVCNKPGNVLESPLLTGTQKDALKTTNRDSPISVAVACASDGDGGTSRCLPMSTSRFGSVPREIAESLDNLTRRQRDAVTRIFDGENLFITGRGGTGKSAILKLVAALNRDGPHFKIGGLALKTKNIVACAPTGIAASSMAFPGSSTVYSKLGISTHCTTPDDLVRHLSKNAEMLDVWETMEVLIIDEISMVDAALMDLIVGTLQCLRGSNSMCQIVVLGDFLQLPPIPQTKSAFDFGRNFAFKAKCWPNLFPFKNVVQLLVCHRHKDSAVLDLMCQEVRLGRVESSTERLIALHEPDEGLKNEDFTTVTTRKADAGRVNNEFMRKLGGEVYTFRARDVCKEFCSQALYDSFMRSCLAERELKLCVGAKVVLVKNLSIPSGLVNGAQGVVTEFVRPENCSAVFPVCEFWGVDTTNEEAPPASFEAVDGSKTKVMLKPVEFSLTRMNGRFEEKLCTRTAVPVIKSFALTAHKAQSLTIRVLSCNFSGV
jgi:ATP-dependent DNA helicase PIF1